MQRIRFKDMRGSASAHLIGSVYDKPGGCETAAAWRVFADTPFNVQVGPYRSMIDEVVPRFKERAAKGEVFFNNLYAAELDISAGTGNGGEIISIADSCTGSNPFKTRYKYEVPGSSPGRLHSGFSYPIGESGLLARPSTLLDNRVLKSMIKEVTTQVLSGRGRTNGNLFETLAELDSALGTLPTVLNTLKQALKPGLLAKAKAAGNAHLLYKYGIKPIISDLRNISEGISKASALIRETTRAKLSTKETKVTIGTPVNWCGAFNYTPNIIETEHVDVRGGSLDEYFATFSNNIGFTFKGLATLPWEMLHHSFVYDWVVNIGDVIGALVPAPGFSQLGSYLTIRRDKSTLFSMENPTVLSGFTSAVPVQGSCSAVWKIKDRGPLAGAPSLVFRHSFKLQNVDRSLTAIALILQQIKPLKS